MRNGAFSRTNDFAYRLARFCVVVSDYCALEWDRIRVTAEKRTYVKNSESRFRKSLYRKMKFPLLFAFSLTITGLIFPTGNTCATQFVVFGDSLSDNGNTLAAAGVPKPPYYDGRWTDGPNWVDYFTKLAQLPTATAYLQNGGTNFAVGGSTSPLLGVQITVYLALNGGHANKDDLYAVWIGGNDFRAGVNASTTVDAIQAGLALLRSAGAERIILLDVPDISLTPHVIAAGGTTDQAAKQFVISVNTNLGARIPLEAFLLGIKLTYVDVNAIFTQIVERPVRFGFSNSSGAAFNPSTGVEQPDPDRYVFWDGFHPTTRAHYLAAWTVFQRLDAPTSFLGYIGW
jgi:phospholipase/lecithinase/hemolysin